MFSDGRFKNYVNVASSNLLPIEDNHRLNPTSNKVSRKHSAAAAVGNGLWSENKLWREADIVPDQPKVWEWQGTQCFQQPGGRNKITGVRLSWEVCLLIICVETEGVLIICIIWEMRSERNEIIGMRTGVILCTLHICIVELYLACFWVNGLYWSEVHVIIAETTKTCADVGSTQHGNIK